jgi:hypothetical protein
MSVGLSKRTLTRDEQRGLHELLHTLRVSLPTDFEPFGKRSREEDWGPDCSCGCLHFRQLEAHSDWGVCANAKSPRAGLLTFEHQGCREFEYDEQIEEDVKRWVEERPDIFRVYNRDELLARCARKEGLDWQAMSEAERRQFTERLLSRGREA